MADSTSAIVEKAPLADRVRIEYIVQSRSAQMKADGISEDCIDLAEHALRIGIWHALCQEREWRGLSPAEVIDVLSGKRRRRKPLPTEGSEALAWLTWFFDDERHADGIIKALREEGFEITRRERLA